MAAAALELEEDTWTRGRALTNLAAAMFFAGDLDSAGELLGQRWTLDGDVIDHAVLAMTLSYRGRTADAIGVGRAALAGATATGSATLMAWAEYALAEAEASAGTGDTETRLRSAVELATHSAATVALGVSQVSLGAHLARGGHVAEAGALYREALDRFLRAGQWQFVWTTLRNVADLFAYREPALAVTIWAAAAADHAAPGLSNEVAQDLDRQRQSIVARLGARAVQALEASAAQANRLSIVERVRAALV